MMKLAKLKLKPGVSLDGLSWYGLQIVGAALMVWGSLRQEYAVVTSGTDGKHGANSLHYEDEDGGDGIDLRTRNLVGGNGGKQAKRAAQMLRAHLGPDYDIVLESNHIHAEYDPK